LIYLHKLNLKLYAFFSKQVFYNWLTWFLKNYSIDWLEILTVCSENIPLSHELEKKWYVIFYTLYIFFIAKRITNFKSKIDFLFDKSPFSQKNFLLNSSLCDNYMYTEENTVWFFCFRWSQGSISCQPAIETLHAAS